MRGVQLGLCGGILALWVLGGSAAHGQAQKPPAGTGQPATTKAAAPAAQPDPRRMEAILKAWSDRSTQVKSLYARFTREDVLQTWQKKTTYEGQAYLRSPNLAYLNFEMVGDDGKPVPSMRIVCTGERVYQFEANTKQVHIYPLAQEDRQRAMEEGPLPFLFNMDAEKAKQRYQMTLNGENEKLYLIAITPLTKVDREAFSQAYIYLDKAKFVPTRILLFDPANGKDTKSFMITEVSPNVKVADGFFDAEGQAKEVVQKAKWDVVVYGPDGQQVGGAPAAADTGAAPAGIAAPRRPAASSAKAAGARVPR